MKIAVMAPSIKLNPAQLKQLKRCGPVSFSARPHDAEILAIDPDSFGGFEKAKDRVTQMAESLPNLKGLALSTTSYGWIDREYFKKRKIPVCNIPGYSREAVAEHTLSLLLCLAKRIIVSDRKTQKGEYKLEMGFELKGKTLGIIGLGNIGSRVAELALGIGMKVIAYNRSPRRQKSVRMVSFEELIKRSDAISLHVIDSAEVKNMINAKILKQMKRGVIIVNTVERNLVNEADMAKTLKSGHVYGYAYEAEDLANTPLAKVDSAIGLKGFGWYTKEALERLTQIWVDNIRALAAMKPQNLVN